jgi:hypothetical protein
VVFEFGECYSCVVDNGMSGIKISDAGFRIGASRVAVFVELSGAWLVRSKGEEQRLWVHVRNLFLTCVLFYCAFFHLLRPLSLPLFPTHSSFLSAYFFLYASVCFPLMRTDMLGDSDEEEGDLDAEIEAFKIKLEMSQNTQERPKPVSALCLVELCVYSSQPGRRADPHSAL